MEVGSGGFQFVETSVFTAPGAPTDVTTMTVGSVPTSETQGESRTQEGVKSYPLGAKTPRPKAKPYNRPRGPVLRKALQRLTTRKLDQRSEVARELRQFRRDVIEDLGGEEMVSRAKAELIEVAARTKVLLDTIDDWVFRQPTIMTRQGELKTIVQQRNTYVETLRRVLREIGLDRKAKPEMSLNDYLKAKEQEKKGGAE